MFIFDLDGTLADCEHRRHFIQKPPMNINVSSEPWKKWKPDWKSFFEACDKDTPIIPVCKMLRALWDDNQFNIIEIWSGRCESVREKTEKWLLDNGVLKGRLRMRAIGDNTPDEILKETWLDEAIFDGKTIEMVFDDRPKVVKMWKRKGIFVFNCLQKDGDF